MKIFLLESEHPTAEGRIVRTFVHAADADAAAVGLVNTMLKDSPLTIKGVPSTKSWPDYMAALQDYHGAAHCYVEVNPVEVEGSDDMVLKIWHSADDAEIEAARNAYADDDLEIDDDAAVSRADDGYWVSAWVWVAGDDDGED